jgi:hypothetical protein
MVGEISKTGIKPVSGAQKLSAEKSKRINELKAAKLNIEKLTKKNGSLLWGLMNISGYTLNDGLANDIIDAGNRYGGPSINEKNALADFRVTMLALDKALTLLGYKRDKLIEAGVPEVKQAEYSWISERLMQFQMDRGLISKDSRDTRSLTGKKTINELIKTINEKILSLQKND